MTSVVTIFFVNCEAGRGLQPRPKRLHASITFETLSVKDGVTSSVPLGVRLRKYAIQPT